MNNRLDYHEQMLGRIISILELLAADNTTGLRNHAIRQAVVELKEAMTPATRPADGG